MARLFKPKVTVYRLGKRRVPKATPGAVKRAEPAENWYGDYIDGRGIRRRRPLTTDRDVAGQMLAELVRKAAAERAGLADPFEPHRKRPLTCEACHASGLLRDAAGRLRLDDRGKPQPCREKRCAEAHLRQFAEHLASLGRSAKHVEGTRSRLHQLFVGCRFERLADLQGSAVAAWLASRRRDGLSTKTSNYYLTAAKMFGNWLVRDQRLPHNPLAYLAAVSAHADARRERRAFEADELARTVEAARAAGPIRGLSGADRAMLYIVAANTGLRAGELASLTAASFDVQADPPTVAVEAAYSKRRRRDVLPLRRDLADALRPWLTARGPGRLWPGSWSNVAAAILRRDLATARAAWIEQAANASERAAREAGDFLADFDASGRALDFHALRHTFVTNLARAGVHPKTAQALARHSTITLTMDRYTHTVLGEQVDALASLPKLPSAHELASPADRSKAGEGRPTLPIGEPLETATSVPVLESADVRATGTEGPIGACHLFARQDGNSRLFASARVRSGESAAGPRNAKIPGKNTCFPEDSARGAGGSRTHDGGFAIRLPGQAPTEPTFQLPNTLPQPEAAGEGQFVPFACAPDGWAGRLAPPPDAELARIIEAWPTLPEAVRAAVLLLVRSAGVAWPPSFDRNETPPMRKGPPCCRSAVLADNEERTHQGLRERKRRLDAEQGADGLPRREAATKPQTRNHCGREPHQHELRDDRLFGDGPKERDEYKREHGDAAEEHERLGRPIEKRPHEHDAKQRPRRHGEKRPEPQRELA